MRHRKREPVVFRGVAATFSDHARAAGIHIHTAWERVARGWSLEEALTTPTFARGQRRERLCGGMSAQGCTVAHSTVYGRLKRGWPREEALHTPPMKCWERRRKAA